VNYIAVENHLMKMNQERKEYHLSIMNHERQGNHVFKVNQNYVENQL